jgi:serine/threonine-protein kinase
LDGQQIGRYLVQRQLGSGGVATVYQAYDQVLGQTVALKVLPPNSDETTLARFKREAKMAGELRHPHIVRIYQVGAPPRGGVAYIAMELVEGESLADLLARQGQMRPAESCKLLEPVARGLAVAHRHGVVHRDVKPGNILLRPASPGAPNSVQLEALDHPVMPLLSDFGVARFLDAPELTRSGRTVGTPAFMAPEQCTGSRTVDGRTDIYALGVVLYRCIVGRLPFVGSTTQVLHDQVYEPVVIEETVLGQLPAVVVTLLQRSLAKLPEERYADADEMASDLAKAAERTPVARSAQAAGLSYATATRTLTSVSPIPAPGTGGPMVVLVPGVGTAKPGARTTGVRLPSPAHGPARRPNWVRWVGALAGVLLAALLGVLFGRILFRAEQAPLATPTALRQLAVLAPVATLTPAPPTAAQTPPMATAEAAPAELPDRAPAAPLASEPAASDAAPDAPPTETANGAPEAVTAPGEAISLTLTPTPAEDDLASETPATESQPLPQTSKPVSESEVLAGTCANVVDEFFVGAMVDIEEGVRSEFSCPTAPAYIAQGAYLAFEQGFMLRLDEDPVIYVYYEPAGEWEQVVTVELSGDGAAAPGVEGGPSGVFGQVWAANQRHLAMGPAVQSVPETIEALVQVFSGGILVGNRADGAVMVFPRSRLRL